MLANIKSFFRDKMQAAPEEATPNAAAGPRHPALHVAACALLLELAHADEEFTDAERAHIEAAVQRHFGLDAGTAAELIQLADQERRQAVDLFQFTALITDHYDLAQKTLLLEAMWGLIYADGHVAKHETYLIRKLSKLLDVSPGYLADAKKRVEQRRDG